jgi:hypothetical protein
MKEEGMLVGGGPERDASATSIMLVTACEKKADTPGAQQQPRPVTTPACKHRRQTSAFLFSFKMDGKGCPRQERQRLFKVPTTLLSRPFPSLPFGFWKGK